MMMPLADNGINDRLVNGRTVPTHWSDVFWVEGVKMRYCLLFSG